MDEPSLDEDKLSRLGALQLLAMLGKVLALVASFPALAVLFSFLYEAGPIVGLPMAFDMQYIDVIVVLLFTLILAWSYKTDLFGFGVNIFIILLEAVFLYSVDPLPWRASFSLADYFVSYAFCSICFIILDRIVWYMSIYPTIWRRVLLSFRFLMYVAWWYFRTVRLFHAFTLITGILCTGYTVFLGNCFKAVWASSVPYASDNQLVTPSDAHVPRNDAADSHELHLQTTQSDLSKILKAD